MIYDWTLESLRRAHSNLPPFWSTTCPAEAIGALANIAEAAQHVVEADRSAWQGSELDASVAALREMFGGKL